MTEFFSKIQPQDMIPVIALVATFLTVGVIVAMFIWRGVRKADIAARLKQDMLDRGMSAEEIRTVLDAGR